MYPVLPWQLHLVSRITATRVPDNFQLVERQLDSRNQRQFLVRKLRLSVDPYMERTASAHLLTEQCAGKPSLDINAQGTHDDCKALPDAIRCGDLETTQALVHVGSSLNPNTHSGLNPRAHASLYGHQDLARILYDPEQKRSPDRPQNVLLYDSDAFVATEASS